jgi:hypothetical protein
MQAAPTQRRTGAPSQQDAIFSRPFNETNATQCGSASTESRLTGTVVPKKLCGKRYGPRLLLAHLTCLRVLCARAGDGQSASPGT